MWTDCIPFRTSSYIENQTPSVMVLGCEDFGRLLGLDEAMKMGPLWMGLVPL